MTDTTTNIPSVAQPVITRDRLWDPVWYQFLLPLFKTVKSTAASLSTVTTTVNQALGQWGVTVNVNGRVTGAIKLDGSATDSSFAVLADHFIIVHPTADGTTIQAFVTGLVNGVATVGVNGNLLVDGSILARSINVGSLSAISANIGTCTAGKVQSADGKFVVDLDNKIISITT